MLLKVAEKTYHGRSAELIGVFEETVFNTGEEVLL